MTFIELSHWMTGFRDLLRFGPSPFHDASDGTPLPPSVAPVSLISDRALRLYLFGPLRAYVAGEVAIGEDFMRQKAKALLALLYLQRGKYISKDELLERLWPDLDELPLDSGRLKQTVLVLRRALEGERSRRTGWLYIVERDGSYFFNTKMAYQSDLEDFEQQLRSAYAGRQRGDTEGALAHFQGAFALRRADLLPEFRYESWATEHIAVEREQYLQALEDAAQLHGARRDYLSAVALLNVAIREDPLRESSVLQLMEWLCRKGDQADAVRVYGRLRDALATKLQLEPEPKLTALYHAIHRDRGALTG
jgi:LuxR family maltose regulon positive regulatory protein